MGGKKVLETKDPAGDVWGNFNSLMMGAFLVNLNELENTQREKLKPLLLTLPCISIFNHFSSSFYYYCQHIKTQNGDRRKFIVRSSDELIKNRPYFEKLYKFMDTIDTVRTCYDYFMEFDVSTFNLENMPKTDYQEDLKSLCVSPVETWN